MSNYNETQTWQEMQDTLQEVFELQAQHEISEELDGEVLPSRSGNAVVIRIYLTPAGHRPVLGSSKNVVGAVGKTIAPSTGKPVVAVKSVDAKTGEVGTGYVFSPQVGANEFEFSFLGPQALKKAGGWLSRQLQRMPKLAGRLSGVKALVNGKPCPECDRQFASQVSGAVPKRRAFNLQIRRDASGKFDAQLGFKGRRGRNFNLNAAGGGGTGFNANVQGTGAHGQTYGGNINAANGAWTGNANMQGPGGQYFNAQGSGGNGNLNLNLDGKGPGGVYGGSFDKDPQGFSTDGFYQGQNGNSFGFAGAGNAGGFQGAGAFNTGNASGQANVNWQQELEASLLGELIQETGF